MLNLLIHDPNNKVLSISAMQWRAHFVPENNLLFFSASTDDGTEEMSLICFVLQI